MHWISQPALENAKKVSFFLSTYLFSLGKALKKQQFET